MVSERSQRTAKYRIARSKEQVTVAPCSRWFIRAWSSNSATSRAHTMAMAVMVRSELRSQGLTKSILTELSVRRGDFVRSGTLAGGRGSEMEFDGQLHQVWGGGAH